MPSIQEIRQKYPQYADMTDAQLAHGLHDKYYADLPFDDFASRIGYEAEVATPQRSRTLPQELGRQTGLATRYAVEGGLGLPSLATDVAKLPLRGLLALENKLRGGKDYTVTMDDGSKVVRNSDGLIRPTSQDISESLSAAGLPNPENRTEEVIGTLARGVAGASSGVGLGGAMAKSSAPVTSGIGQVLESRPLVQGVSAITSGLSAEGAKSAGAGPMGQLAAGLGGGALPGFVGSGAPMATRAAFRGGEEGRQAMQGAIDTFRDVGTTPSVGQATQGRIAQAAEGLLSRSPGGGGVIAGKAATQADEIAAGIEARASQLMKKTTGEQAGRTIERGIKGEGGFIEKFKAKQGLLYDELDKQIPDKQIVDVSKTRNALSSLNQDIDGAENLSKWFKNSRIRGIWEAFQKDTDPAKDGGNAIDRLRAAKSVSEIDDVAQRLKIGMADEPSSEQLALEDEFFKIRAALKAGKSIPTNMEAAPQSSELPYEAVKKLRTLVGREIDNSTIASDVPRSKWKALYGALSQDIEGAAKKAGPKAEQAWSRANTYTRAGMDRVDSISSVIDKNGGPEAIFRAATANTKEGATTLRAVMQSLDGEGQKTVSATVLRRLGLAKEGAQGELGDRFSTESFLTNWNKLSPEAKRTLFDRYGTSFRNDMDQVAKVAANLRAGSQVFKNPSGTAQALTQTQTVGGIALAAMTGHMGAAAAIAGGVAGSNLLARLMTNPRFVRWLAQSTQHPLAHTPSMLNSLVQQANESNDADLARGAALLEQAYRQKDQENNR